MANVTLDDVNSNKKVNFFSWNFFLFGAVEIPVLPLLFLFWVNPDPTQYNIFPDTVSSKMKIALTHRTYP